MTSLMNFETITKKHRRRRLMKTVFLSLFLMTALAVLAVRVMVDITSSRGDKLAKDYTLKASIAYPNIGYTTWGFRADSPISGTFHVNRHKDLAGIIVPFDDYEADYSLFWSEVPGYADGIFTNGEGTYSQGDNNRMAVFYNRSLGINYLGEPISPDRDLTYAKSLPNQVLEYAITFDKAYSYEELVDLIPEELQENWYWVGPAGNEDSSVLQPGELLGFQPIWEMDYDAETMVKFQEAFEKDPSTPYLTSDEAVDRATGFANSYSHFRANLTKALEQDMFPERYINGQLIQTRKAVQDYLDANPTGKEAKFAGVILTGKAEDFVQLETKSWIYASSLGAHIPLQPYHEPTDTDGK